MRRLPPCIPPRPVPPPKELAMKYLVVCFYALMSLSSDSEDIEATEDTRTPCERAYDYVSECLEVRIPVSPACNSRIAARVLSMSCEEIITDVRG